MPPLTTGDLLCSHVTMAARTITIAFGVVALAMVVAFVAVTAMCWMGRDDVPRESISGDSIVLLGDSITFGGQWSQLLPGVPVVSHGYPGYTTEQLLPVAEEIASGSPRAVFVMTGTNDVRDGRPPAWTVARLERLLDAIVERSPDTVVVVQSILPRAEEASEIVATNAAIRTSVEGRGIAYVDLHAVFDDGSGGLRPRETTDGWHLSDAGYRRWSEQLGRLVAALVPVDGG